MLSLAACDKTPDELIREKVSETNKLECKDMQPQAKDDASPGCTGASPYSSPAPEALNPKLASKRAHSEDVLVSWLKEHFEESAQDTIARDYLYNQYCLFCQNVLQTQHMNAASLGKVMRSVFPGLSTRRLGARGQSKYHYNNIRLRLSSSLPRTEEHGTIYSTQVSSRTSFASQSYALISSSQQRNMMSSIKGVTFGESAEQSLGQSDEALYENSISSPGFLPNSGDESVIFSQVPDGAPKPFPTGDGGETSSMAQVDGKGRRGAGDVAGKPAKQRGAKGKRGSMKKHHPYGLSSSGLAAAAVLESVANSGTLSGPSTATTAPNGAFSNSFVSPTAVYLNLSTSASGDFLPTIGPQFGNSQSGFRSPTPSLQLETKMVRLNEIYQRYTSHVSSLMYSNQMDAVPEIMATFWNQFPNDMAVFLHHNDCVYQLESLEHILHSSILNSFDSVLLEKLHPRLVQDMEHFASHFALWESLAIDGKVPKRLQDTLLNAAQVFEASLTHRLATNKYLENFQRQLKLLAPALSAISPSSVFEVLAETDSANCVSFVFKSLVELILNNAAVSQYANLTVNAYLQHMTGVPCEEEPFRMRSRGFWLVMFDHFQQAASLLIHQLGNINKNEQSKRAQQMQLTSALHSLLQFLLYYSFLVTEKGIAQNFKNLPERYGACADFINAGMVAQMTPLEDLGWTQFIQRAVTTAVTFTNNTAIFTHAFKSFNHPPASMPTTYSSTVAYSASSATPSSVPLTTSASPPASHSSAQSESTAKHPYDSQQSLNQSSNSFDSNLSINGYASYPNRCS